MGARLPLTFAFIIGLAGTAVAAPQANTEIDPSSKAIFDTGYIQVPDDMASESHSSNIIYLNPCWGGCGVKRGYPDDSRTDTSSIIDGNVTISEFAHGQAAWDSVVQCVRNMYEPFNIEIVDKAPGNVPHFEAITAGRPQEAGFPSYVGGVAPFSCGIINNAITYSFANLYESTQAICEVVAQETAHAFGLDHEYYCPDNMTYLYGCGAKSFTDFNADCGEDKSRACQCGGNTQNSYQRIIQHFGTAQPTPPTVSISQPLDGSQVTPEFIIRVDAVDDISVERVELYLNGSLSRTIGSSPFVFDAPADLAKGPVDIEVRAYDNRDAMGSASASVTLGEPCTQESECGEGNTCVDGRCVPGGVDGGLGDTCMNDDECLSGTCAGPEVGQRYCVEYCIPEENGCPSGFKCANAGDDGVCWPSDGEGGGCTATTERGATGTLPMALLGLFGLGLLLRRRRA